MPEPEPENKGFFQPDGLPDWDAITFDVLCSRCGYNLRTLTRPKCTECGLEFNWQQVITWTAHQSDFLFEHHWRRHPLHSFVETVWRSLRPRTFWASVSIHQQIRSGALWFLILIAPLVFWALVMGVAYGVTNTVALFDRSFPTGAAWRAWWAAKSPVERHFIQLLWEFAEPFHGITLTYYSVSRAWWMWLPIIASLWILLGAMIAVLCGLRQTLARCRVRTVQMLRVVAYAAIPASICSAIALLANLCIFKKIRYDHFLRSDYIIQPSGPLILVLVFSFYVHSGLKHYLRLSRSRRMALTAAFVGLLAVANFLGAWLLSPIGLRWFPQIMPFY